MNSIKALYCLSPDGPPCMCLPLISLMSGYGHKHILRKLGKMRGIGPGHKPKLEFGIEGICVKSCIK